MSARAGRVSLVALAGLFAFVGCTDSAAPAPSHPDAGEGGTAAGRGDGGGDAATAMPDADASGGSTTDAAPGTAPDGGDAVDNASHDAGAGTSAPEEESRCEIGIAQGDASFAFAPLMEGETIPLVGAAQGSLSVELALQVLDPPLPIDVRVVVRAIESGRNRLAVRSMESDFVCDGEGWCSLAPFYVPTQTLVDDPFDLMFLDVAITATFGEPGAPHCLTTLIGQIERKP